jgi:hypothetical protein
MKAEHRPMIGLSAIQDIKDSTAVYVSFQNIGKSPAFGTSIGIRTEVEGLHPSAPYGAACNYDCRIKDFEMMPNVPLSFRVPKTDEAQIPADKIQRITARIDYRDADGTQHNVGICLLKSQNDMSTCRELDSNYVDKK